MSVLSKTYVSLSFCSILKSSFHWYSEDKRKRRFIHLRTCVEFLYEFTPPTTHLHLNIYFQEYSAYLALGCEEAMDSSFLPVGVEWFHTKEILWTSLKKISHLCSEEKRQVFILGRGFVLCFACSRKQFALGFSKYCRCRQGIKIQSAVIYTISELSFNDGHLTILIHFVREFGYLIWFCNF